MGTLLLKGQDGIVQKLLLVTEEDFERLKHAIEFYRRRQTLEGQFDISPSVQPHRRLRLVKPSERAAPRLYDPLVITLWAVLRLWRKTIGVTSQEVVLKPWHYKSVDLLEPIVVTIPA